MKRSRNQSDQVRARKSPRGGAGDCSVTSATSRPRHRVWLFRCIVVLLPFVFLLLAEGVLRLIGFGHPLEPLFIASPQQAGYLQANPRAVTRLFADPRQAPAVSIETAYFRAVKKPGTLRVFVQGESSAAGFPYGLGAALAGILDQRFERAFPSREVEVISTAMAAVNSYALLDFADEIIAQQPDAIVVYVGHNEYLGVLGVGSALRLAGTPALTRAYLAVREWRLFQAMSRLLLRKSAVGAEAAGSDPADTLMSRVAGERSISLNSALFRAGENQFRDNLDRLLRRYRDAGLPVFIGSLVSNERDQMPLAVLAGAESDAAGAAKTAYHAAQDAEAAGQFDSARDGYAWARDLDPLRFRAPGSFNSIVAASAAHHGATFVDVHERFASASQNGLIGNSLLLEHVHPNLDGYFILADAFFDSMIAHGVPGKPDVIVSDDVARTEMPLSDIDRWLGEYKLRRIRSAWPFTVKSVRPGLPAPQSEGERLAQELYAERISWPDAQEQLRRYYRASGNKPEYTRITAILADAFPFAPGVQFEAAAAMVEAGRPADGWRYAERAVNLDPRNVNNLLVGAHSLLLSGRSDQGKVLLLRVLELEPANPTARQVLEEMEHP